MEGLLTSDNLEKTGMALALIFSIWCNWKIVSNHIAHNIVSQEKLTAAINDLIKFLEKKFKKVK